MKKTEPNKQILATNSQSGENNFWWPPTPTFFCTYGNPAAKAQHLPPAWKTEVRREPVLPLCLCHKVILVLLLIIISVPPQLMLNSSTSTQLPPFPAQTHQERVGKVLENSLWNLACEAWIYQSKEVVCVSTCPAITSKGRTRRSFKRVPLLPLLYF